VTTVVDPCRSAHSRLHEIIRALTSEHEVHILSLSENIRARSADLIAYSNSAAAYLDGSTETHIASESVPMYLQEPLSFLLARKAALAAGNVDALVDYNTFTLGKSVGRCLADNTRGSGLPRIYDLADDIPAMVDRAIPFREQFGPLARLAAGVALRRSLTDARAVTTTRPLLAEAYGADVEKIVWVPNGVDGNLFRPQDKGAARAKLGIPGRGLILGYVGVLREWVEFDAILLALRRLSRAGESDALLLVAGTEGRISELTGKVRALGIESNVKMLGTLDYSKIPTVINACDLTLVPFKASVVAQEAVPLKVLEALACGVPVAGTPLRGMRETFGDSIAYCDSADDYFRLFQLLANDPFALKDVALRGRERVLKQFQWEKTLQAFKAAVRAAIGLDRGM